jgi:hypothetical protein
MRSFEWLAMPEEKTFQTFLNSLLAVKRYLVKQVLRTNVSAA